MMAIYTYFRMMLWRMIRWNPPNPPPNKKQKNPLYVSPAIHWLTSCQWLCSSHRWRYYQGQGYSDWVRMTQGGAWNHCSSSVNHGYMQGNVQSSLRCTKKASQARLLLLVRFALKLINYQIIKNFNEKGSVVWRRLQGVQESPASIRTVS